MHMQAGTSHMTEKTDIGWAILELMGHRRLGGYISQQEIAGGALLRIDVPCEPPATQLYSPGAVYCITPVTEEMARAVAARSTVAPVHRWELPAPKRDDGEPDEISEAELAAQPDDDFPY